jgi:hypothetical protein
MQSWGWQALMSILYMQHNLKYRSIKWSFYEVPYLTCTFYLSEISCMTNLWIFVKYLARAVNKSDLFSYIIFPRIPDVHILESCEVPYSRQFPIGLVVCHLGWITWIWRTVIYFFQGVCWCSTSAQNTQYTATKCWHALLDAEIYLWCAATIDAYTATKCWHALPDAEICLWYAATIDMSQLMVN